MPERVARSIFRGVSASLGLLRGVSASERWLGAALLAAALALTVFLQRIQLELRREEAAKWWVSNGRDLVNVLSLAALYGSVWMLGFSGPCALLLAATLLLLLNLLEAFLLQRPSLPAQALSLGLALALCAPLVAMPERVSWALNEIASQLIRASG